VTVLAQAEPEQVEHRRPGPQAQRGDQRGLVAVGGRAQVGVVPLHAVDLRGGKRHRVEQRLERHPVVAAPVGRRDRALVAEPGVRAVPGGVEVGLLGHRAVDPRRRRSAGQRDVEGAPLVDRRAGDVHPQPRRRLRDRLGVGGDEQVRPVGLHQAPGPRPAAAAEAGRGAAGSLPVAAGYPAASQAAVPPMTLTMGPGCRAARSPAAIAER
jgi:hypothetical protein